MVSVSACRRSGSEFGSMPFAGKSAAFERDALTFCLTPFGWRNVGRSPASATRRAQGQSCAQDPADLLVQVANRCRTAGALEDQAGYHNFLSEQAVWCGHHDSDHHGCARQRSLGVKLHTSAAAHRTIPRLTEIEFNQVLARVLECCQSCRDLALEFGTFAPILTALTAASGSSGVSAALFGALKGSPNGDLFLVPPLLEKSRFLSGTPNLRLTSRCQGRGLDRGRRRRRRSPSGSYNAPSRGHGRRKASWSEARCA